MSFSDIVAIIIIIFCFLVLSVFIGPVWFDCVRSMFEDERVDKK